MNIGIDIGTSFSYVCYIDKLQKAKVIPDPNSAMSATPSVINLTDSGCLIGQPALDKLLADPNANIIQFFKREIGSDKVIAYDNDGQAWYAEGLTALMLKKMIKDASAAGGQKIKRATFTVPVHFNEIQRAGMLHAGAIAGIHNIQLLDEPIAAAIYYGFSRIQQEQSKNILVYDLGGGTFDVAILKLSVDRIIVVASHGDITIGGKELDEVVMRLMKEQITTMTSSDIWNAYNLNLLRKQAEQIKKDLLSKDNSEVENSISKDSVLGDVLAVDIVLGDDVFSISLPLQEFFNGVFNLIRKTFKSVRHCLSSSPYSINEIDDHIFVGGSCDNDIIKHLYADEFQIQQDKIHIREPHLAVAMGAAIHSNRDDLRSRNETNTVFPELRGVSGSEISMKVYDASSQKVNDHILIRRNVSLPCFAKKIIYPSQLDQDYIRLEFFSRLNSESITMGELKIGPLSIDKLNYEIELSLKLNDKGMLEVVCLDLQTGEEVSSTFSLLNSTNSIAIDQKELVENMIIN